MLRQLPIFFERPQMNMPVPITAEIISVNMTVEAQETPPVFGDVKL